MKTNAPLNFTIDGGRKLRGAITTNTSKNSAVALLCASLLNKNKTTIRNIAKIEEVARILEVLKSLGVRVRWIKGQHVEITPPQRIDINNLNEQAAMQTRSAVLLVGPLIHVLKSFSLPHPGGCKLGKRTIRPHLFGLEEFGVRIDTKRDVYRISHKKLSGAEIILYESSDTATENILMAAAKIPATSIIKFASANYQVQDLCWYLQALGVDIQGIGTTTLIVKGVASINTPVIIEPTEDPIEAMLFLSIAATTNSAITIKRAPIDFLEIELLKLKKMGFRYKILRRYKALNACANLVDIQTFSSKLIALQDKIEARPYPGLNIDNLPFFVPIATQAKGTTLIHDWVFENRAIYYMELTKLGANAILADPHRIYVEGKTKLHGTEIICPPALRPAVIILIAMLAAKGTSILRNVYSINRGYEDLATRLNMLGARIQVF